MLHDAVNDTGLILGSKSCGEAGLCLASVVSFAAQYAINAARADAGITGVLTKIESGLCIVSTDIVFHFMKQVSAG